MLPSSNDDIPFYPNVPTRFSHIISYVDFNQEEDDDDHIEKTSDTNNNNNNNNDNNNRQEFPLPSTILLQRLTRQQTQIPLQSPRFINSSLLASSSLLKDTTITFVNERDERKIESVPVDDDVKQSRTDSTPPAQIIETTDREQQTSPFDMSLLDDEDDILTNLTTTNIITPRFLQQQQRSISNQRESNHSSMKRSSSEEQVFTTQAEDEQQAEEDDDDGDEVRSPHQIKSVITTTTTTAAPLPPPTTVATVPMGNQLQVIPKIKYPIKTPSSSMSNVGKTGKLSSLKWSSSLNTSRSMPALSISRRAVQGVLVRFFRSGEEYHPGVKMAINEFELKSWEAFLNYLNRQPRLALSTGGIKHVYTLTGQEIRSIGKLQHRQSYTVSSGVFVRTNYRYANDSFGDDTDTNANVQHDIPPYWNTRASVHPRWRSPPPPLGDQIFLLPYSRLNMYESLLLNRYPTQTFDEWLQDQVSDLLSHYTNHEDVTHLFAITKSSFMEIRSFSKLFHLIKLTDTFIGCTEDEYVHAKHYLGKMKPSELFLDRVWPRKALTGKEQRFPSKRVMEDAKINLNWIHGYDGENDLTKNLYTLPENEILYFIGSICILYEPNLKNQRFYIQHTNPITYVNVHQYQSIVASSEIGSSKANQRALIHIWDHVKLRTIAEIRKEQFGSYINLLAFSPKPDDNLLLLTSRDKPQLVLFLDWKRNELIYSITCKSDNILSVLFVFDTTEWIACVSQRHLLFYHVNWSIRPLRMLERKESEVQNIYTGAAACDTAGDRLLVGDKVGSVYVWRLIDNEPQLVAVQENILEDDVETIVPLSQEAFVLGNKENQIKIWNVKSNTVEQIRLNENIGSIRSICIIRRGSTANALAIGTKSNYIISKDLGSEQFDAIMRGHTSPSICLCCDKDSHYFFSISSDRHLFKWNNITRAVEWSAKSTQPISCADLHPERNIIVLGSETSKLLVYDTLSSYYITTITLKMSTGVKSVRFSPDGSHLAVGLLNGSVCVFDVLGNGEFHLRPDGILQNDTAAVSDTTWSKDSKYLLAVYSDNDYTIWEVSTLEVFRGKSLDSIEWNQIVHPIMCDILDRTTVLTHTSPVVLNRNLVLCCGKDGQLRLFRNRHERHSQTFQLGLGPIQTLVPSTTTHTYLFSLTNTPVVGEIQVNINSHFS